MTVATLIALAAEESEHHGNVALETVGFGLIAIVVFISLAFVTLSYRNVANRHAHKAEAYARAHANDVQQAGHGH
jgi:heme/copper-type cytochrome/quinol oxidase subunit 2